MSVTQLQLTKQTMHPATSSRPAALLRILAIAVEQQLPLVPLLDAFASDAGGRWGRRVRDLADRIRAGEDLAMALSRSPGLLPRETVLAVEIGMESGTLAASLRTAASVLARAQDPSIRSFKETYIYLVALANAFLWILGFLMVFIIPKFKKIFEDFGMELPDLTMAIIDAADWFVAYLWLFVPIGLLAVYLALTWIPIGTVRQWPFGRILEWVWWIPRRCTPRLSSPWILRILAVVVAGGRPLAGAILSLAHHHPVGVIRRRMQQVYVEVGRGVDTWHALEEVGLIRSRHTAVLQSAERAGNLDWALVEMANDIERRQTTRSLVVLEFIRPVMLLLFGLTVGLIVIGMFLPLISLINALS